MQISTFVARIVCTVALAVLITAQTVSDFEIGLKTLILSSDETLVELPVAMAMAYGVDYDLVSLDEQGALRIELIDPATSMPKYNSIIQTSASLGYFRNGAWVGNGIGDQKEAIDEYCVTYGVRRVMLNSGPYDVGDYAMYGLWGRGTTTLTNVSFTSDPVVSELRNVVKPGVPIQVGTEHRYAGNTYWINPAYINPAFNTDGHIQPFLDMNFRVTRQDAKFIPVAFGTMTTCVGGIIHNNVENGAQIMYFFFTANSYGLHGPTLAHAWFPWVTKGLMMGQRRILLHTDIDDFYLDTNMYNTTLDRQALSDEYGPPFGYRTTANDLSFHATVQNNVRTISGPGSNFTIQMAFNGKGYGEYANYRTPRGNYLPDVNPQTIIQFNQFLWLTHTWNHIDMYCLYSNCESDGTNYMDPRIQACNDWTNGACPDYVEPTYPKSGYTPYEYNLYELTRNQYFAATTLNVAAHPAVWSGKSIVTPRISGLNYTESIRAMLKAGLRYATGDNSRKDLKPENPFHPFNARVKAGPGGVLLNDAEKDEFSREMNQLYGVDSILVLPRFATRIYFDVATKAQLVMEHNSFYGPNCHGFDQYELPVAGGFKCNANTFKYPRNLNANEILAIEGFETARNLLLLRTDPYMFHQVNLRVVNGESLLSLWINAVVHWINLYTSFPILSYKMDDLAEFYLQRRQRDECGLQGKVKYTGGNPVSLAVSAQGDCVAKVTHSATVGSLPKPTIAGFAYGTHDVTYDVPIAAGSTQVLQLGA